MSGFVTRDFSADTVYPVYMSAQGLYPQIGVNNNFPIIQITGSGTIDVYASIDDTQPEFANMKKVLSAISEDQTIIGAYKWIGYSVASGAPTVKIRSV